LQLLVVKQLRPQRRLLRRASDEPAIVRPLSQPKPFCHFDD
jgi:hypothetical protein